LGASITSRVVGDILRALPPSCASLELDSGGIDDHYGGLEHLCCTVRSILPRLRHLRLRLRRFCPNLFDPKISGAAPNSASEASFKVSHLHTMTLNLNPEFFPEGGRACIAMDIKSVEAENGGEDYDENSKGIQPTLASTLRSPL